MLPNNRLHLPAGAVRCTRDPVAARCGTRRAGDARAVMPLKEGVVENRRKMRVPIQDAIRFVTRLVTPDRSVIVGFVVPLSARGRGRPPVETLVIALEAAS